MLLPGHAHDPGQHPAWLSQVSALQHATASGLRSHAALLAATAAAGGWPMQTDTLALAVQCAGPLASGFHSMLLPDTAAMQAAVHAASVQQQLAMLQATADASSLLSNAADSSATGYLAGACARQPLHPLSLNLGGFGHAQLQPHSAAAACFGSGF